MTFVTKGVQSLFGLSSTPATASVPSTSSSGSDTTPTSSISNPPANPPVYGSSTQKSGGASTTSTWAGSLLGAATQPQYTTKKTLLGA